MSQYFGFELLFHSVRADLKENHELLVVVCHWFLIRENFLCLGVGTEREVLDSDTPSELLPTGWNENQETFYLRYFNAEQKRVIVLDVTMSSPGEAVITIAGEEPVSKGFTMKIQDYFGDFSVANNTRTKIQHIMPKIDEFMYKFHTNFKDLITVESASKASSTGTESKEQETPSPAVPRMPDLTSYPPITSDPMAPFRDIGRGDLDPFHRGGGMLVPPLPGVRFDPVGPVPNYDHFPPPGGPGFDTDPESYMLRNPNRRPRNRPDLIGPPQNQPPGNDPFNWYS